MSANVLTSPESSTPATFTCRAGLTRVNNQTGIWVQSPRTKRRIEIPEAMFHELPNRVASRITAQASVGRLAVMFTREELHAIAAVHEQYRAAQYPDGEDKPATTPASPAATAPVAPVAPRPANPWTGWRHPRGNRRAKAYTAAPKAVVTPVAAAPVATAPLTPLERHNRAMGTNFASLDQLSHRDRMLVDIDYRIIADGTRVRFSPGNVDGPRNCYGVIICRRPRDGAYLIHRGDASGRWVHRLCVEIAPALPTRGETPQS